MRQEWMETILSTPQRQLTQYHKIAQNIKSITTFCDSLRTEELYTYFLCVAMSFSVLRISVLMSRMASIVYVIRARSPLALETRRSEVKGTRQEYRNEKNEGSNETRQIAQQQLRS
jgi:hypothetical protein